MTRVYNEEERRAWKSYANRVQAGVAGSGLIYEGVIYNSCSWHALHHLFLKILGSLTLQKPSLKSNFDEIATSRVLACTKQTMSCGGGSQVDRKWSVGVTWTCFRQAVTQGRGGPLAILGLIRRKVPCLMPACWGPHHCWRHGLEIRLSPRHTLSRRNLSLITIAAQSRGSRRLQTYPSVLLQTKRKLVLWDIAVVDEGILKSIYVVPRFLRI
ncbi:hypothetical protein J6590_000193 [Homalodisca vitripennis]|nr:hypothetical protein J6590_000193 [Homalodisca vitripennis]